MAMNVRKLSTDYAGRKAEGGTQKAERRLRP
jgi:hypothetical protein